eukprot:COSAG01_NODE_7518_length_3169_cov_5.177524_4_plen_51_part_00
MAFGAPEQLLGHGGLPQLAKIDRGSQALLHTPCPRQRRQAVIKKHDRRRR